MKTLLFSLLASTLLFGQPNYSAVLQAIQQANAAALATHLDTRVEITIDDKDHFVSAAEATQIVGEFFAKNKPQSCQLVHSGSTRDGNSNYLIGKLATGRKNYRVYILFKLKTERHLIQEMRFEPA